MGSANEESGNGEFPRTPHFLTPHSPTPHSTEGNGESGNGELGNFFFLPPNKKGQWWPPYGPTPFSIENGVKKRAGKKNYPLPGG
jgi:hypothetical protein